MNETQMLTGDEVKRMADEVQQAYSSGAALPADVIALNDAQFGQVFGRMQSEGNQEYAWWSLFTRKAQTPT